jgi:PPOX class probable F420-dependent enzyme
MTDEEIDAFLGAARTIILVSNGANGFPHPMPMWFAVEPDRTVRMATYKASQKVRNLERDPRVSLLVESGTEYSELRGVVLYGNAELLHDYELACDTMIRAGGDPRGLPEDPEARQKALDGMRKMAGKRVVIRVKPGRIVTWDHAKLAGAY